MKTKKSKPKAGLVIRDAQLMKMNRKSFLLVRFDPEDGNRVSASFSDKGGLTVKFSRSVAIASAFKKKTKKGASRVARA